MTAVVVVREGKAAGPVADRPTSTVAARSGPAKGVDSKVVALAWVEGTYPVVTLAGSGIRDIADLKASALASFGRKTAFDLSCVGQLNTYTATLGTVGLTLEDVELVEISRAKFDPTAVPTKDTKRQSARDATATWPIG